MGRTIEVEIVEKADWDESLHPRDESGRFGSGGGDKGAARGRLAATSSRRFKMNDFEKLASKCGSSGSWDDTVAMIAVNDYLKENARFIGSGSSRNAYALSSGKVLKFAKSEAGFAQNKVEIEIAKAEPDNPLITKVYSHSEGNAFWIIQELVRPIADDKEFARLSGGTATVQDFAKDVAASTPPTTPLVAAARELTARHGVSAPDMGTIYQWGVNTSGQLRLLDYGVTADVWDKHYKERRRNA